MSLRTMPVRITGRAVCRAPSVASRRTFTSSQNRGETANHHNVGGSSTASDMASKYWKLVAGATVAVAGISYIFSSSRPRASPSSKKPQSQSQSHSTDSEHSSPELLFKKYTPANTKDPDRKGAVDERGLQPNAGEAAHDDQKSSETTGSNTQKGNTVERIPDAKGGFKKRMSSNAGMKQGTADKTPDGVHDKVAASKPAGGSGTTSGKQEGVTNTDTKYSIDLTNSTDFSQKGEGTPETSKSKGTVDVRRPLSS